jgi:ABC-type bacteriocin/lantibiotic exporter with double-glycine peptidase domain
MIFNIAIMAILFAISPALAGVTISSIVPVMIFGIFYGIKIRGITKEAQDKKGVMGSVAEESFSNIRTVKAYATEMHELGKYSE